MRKQSYVDVCYWTVELIRFYYIVYSYIRSKLYVYNLCTSKLDCFSKKEFNSTLNFLGNWLEVHHPCGLCLEITVTVSLFLWRLCTSSLWNPSSLLGLLPFLWENSFLAILEWVSCRGHNDNEKKRVV